MRHIIEAGTDSAMLSAFDPLALPANFDIIIGDDPDGLMQDLQEQGKLWYDGRGGDGSYVFHIYVDEPPAPIDEATKEKRTLVAEFPAFPCPSGTVYFCGAEYAANDPEKGSEQTPPGGLDSDAKISIPVGVHKVIFYEIEREMPKIKFQWGHLYARFLMILSIICGIGGVFVAFISLSSLLLGTVGKAWQYITGSPLASIRWEAIGGIFLVMVFGVILSAVGVGLGRVFDKTKFSKQEQKLWKERVDYIIEITTMA